MDAFAQLLQSNFSNRPEKYRFWDLTVADAAMSEISPEIIIFRDLLKAKLQHAILKKEEKESSENDLGNL